MIPAVTMLFLAAMLTVQPVHGARPTGEERAVLSTVAGDIVVSFFPDAAPKTVAQVLELMRLGVYDSTHFYRVEPGYLIQLANAEDRLVPMLPSQREAIHNVPLETVSWRRHYAGYLTMAHGDDSDDGATSFSILLADSPHLDGKYTVFGRVEKGLEVLKELAGVKRDSGNHPAVRLTLERVTVVNNPKSLAVLPLRPAHAVHESESHASTTDASMTRILVGGLLILIALAFLAVALAKRIPLRQLTALNLLVALVGVFLLLVVAQPWAREAPLLGAFLFLLLVGTFKALGRFESL